MNSLYGLWTDFRNIRRWGWPALLLAIGVFSLASIVGIVGATQSGPYADTRPASKEPSLAEAKAYLAELYHGEPKPAESRSPAATRPTPAQTFTETDFLRQSKFCESALRGADDRFPGLVHEESWFDCMERQGTLRTKEQQKEQQKANDALPCLGAFCPWVKAWSKSLLSATYEGCEKRARDSDAMKKFWKEHFRDGLARGYLNDDLEGLERDRWAAKLEKDPEYLRWSEDTHRVMEEVRDTAWNRCMEQAGVFTR